MLRGLAGCQPARRRNPLLTPALPDRPPLEDERKRLADWYIERRAELSAFLDDLSWELIVATSAAAEEYYKQNDTGQLAEHADRLEAINRSMENLSRMEEMNRLRARRGK